jgi:hypothetical protein
MLLNIASARAYWRSSIGRGTLIVRVFGHIVGGVDVSNHHRAEVGCTLFWPIMYFGG